MATKRKDTKDGYEKLYDEMAATRVELLDMAKREDSVRFKTLADKMEDYFKRLDELRDAHIDMEECKEERIDELDFDNTFLPSISTLQDESKAMIAKRLCDNLTQEDLEELELMMVYKYGSNYRVGNDPVPHIFNSLVVKS